MNAHRPPITALFPLLLLLLAGSLAGQVGKNEKVKNPNLAGEEELAALPHLTAEIAKTIVAQRPFLSIVQLDRLLRESLDDAARAEVYQVLFIPIDLNAASREEILLVPGVGKRMAHEFEEYRPYKALAQFRREIGKYVDEVEVARLEQFVFIPLDLNSATAEEFATIPGVGKRMVHEFMEYRPYKSIEQFRREIGKYVSKEEVARLERYVLVPKGVEAQESGEKDPEKTEKDPA